jgi:hypothetical protein
LARILPAEDMQDINNVPAWGVWVFNLVGVLFNVIFGTLGGLIGGAILRTDRGARKL